MDTDDAIAIIRRHKSELNDLGVISLSLFGSTVRDTATENSDVDVVVRLEEIRSGFETFGRLERITERLSALIGRRVDVIPEPEEPDRLKATIDRDRRIAF